MTIPKHIGSRILVLLVLQTLCWDTSLSQQSGGTSMKEQLARQETIYQRKSRRAGYTVDRTLSDYASTLSPRFDRALADLGPDDRWLDVGAGEGQAILDYYTPDYDRSQRRGKRRGKKAQAVAISIEDRRTAAWQETATRLGPGQIRYLAGKRLRQYSRKELGRFQVITDVMGGFTYAQDLSLFVERVLGLLDVNGDFYTVLQDVHSEHGANPAHREGMPYLTEIANADGAEVKVCSWLKNIACVNVTCELKDDMTVPVETFHVHKVCDDVAVPPLVPVHYEAGTPPERRFRLDDSKG